MAEEEREKIGTDHYLFLTNSGMVQIRVTLSWRNLLKKLRLRKKSVTQHQTPLNHTLIFAKPPKHKPRGFFITLQSNPSILLKLLLPLPNIGLQIRFHITEQALSSVAFRLKLQGNRFVI